MITQHSQIIGNILLLCADSTAYFFVLLKIFRVLCYTKLTFDQLPCYNPYRWPLSLIRIITKPYFQFWTNILPGIPGVGKGTTTYDIGVILGLEFLVGLATVISYLKLIFLIEAERCFASIT